MSFSPSLSLVRLQELKLWQGSYENLIQKSKINSQPSHIEHLEGVSVLDNSNASDISSEGGKKNPRDWDKKKISPCKPFEQLLEEKLAEDTPMEGNMKPKKPFLKKGQGLARFRMGPGGPASNKSKDLASKKPSGKPKNPSTPIFQHRGPPTARKGILIKSNPLYHQFVDIDLSPLTLPDFIKPRGTWKSVFEKKSEKEIVQEKKINVDKEEEVEDYEEFRMSLGYGENVDKNVEKVDRGDEIDDQEVMFTPLGSKNTLRSHGEDEIESYDESEQQGLSNHKLETLNKKIINKINDFAQKYFQPAKTYLSNDIPESIQEIYTPKFKNGTEDLTLYEQQMERELKIFEELEKKVENSSFCSTNTSVANLLASTPRKLSTNTNLRKDIVKKKDALSSLGIPENILEFTNDRNENIQFKLQEVAEKTNVLQQFLMNLRKMDKGVQQGDSTVESDLTKKSEKSTSTDTSFSEENTRWSTRSPSLTDNYTEYDTTGQSDSWKKIDACVNTSFDGSGLDETVKKWEPCKECEELRLKFSDTKMKMSDIRSENSNLKVDLKELEKRYEQLKKDTKKSKENYQEELENLQEELDNERKKFAREKTYFESYVKESQNRATKKEREEITQLKQELVDTKELLKLKDTKSGATQARLRTQIKQQEREISELKITVEKLQKENAKLNASQKYMRRPQEVKMLHEINKNISKLTEETFKKQMNKSESSDVDEKNGKGLKREGKKSVSYDNEIINKENDKYGKNVSNKEVQKNVLTGKESFKMDSAALNLTNSEALTIERQYEHVFGHFSSPRNSNVSTNSEKTEKILPDGSVEITYSNGNVKTISADGLVIVIKYFNGDTKETNLTEKIIRYHYAATDSWHTQFEDGSEVMEYKDGEKCKKHTDGKTEVSYPDGSIRIINSDSTEEHQFPDGRKTLKNLQGEQIILLPNGQREIHTKEYKRREYPDGTIRTLRKDGSVETVYSNGRVRLKDSSGILVMDTLQSPQS